MTDSVPAAEADARRVVPISIELIRPGPSQARTLFENDSIEELAASIATSGVIQPVVVRGDHATGYRLLAGERAHGRADAEVVVLTISSVVFRLMLVLHFEDDEATRAYFMPDGAQGALRAFEL